MMPDALFSALERTWPPAAVTQDGDWIHRDGQGGGKRVSASSYRGTDDALARPGAALIQIRFDQPGLKATAEKDGYTFVDETVFRVARSEDLASAPPAARVFFGWPTIAIHRALWARAGVGPGRLAVMDRVTAPKTALLGRVGDAPLGVAFAAVADDVAMIHALEVMPEARRSGLGRQMVGAAANWALQHGAPWFALAVTQANTGAGAFYDALGFAPADTGYVYATRGET